jgi:hypothetical protein
MKRSVQFLAIPVLALAFFSFSAFKAPGKNIVNGGGFTHLGVSFNFNAVQLKNGYAGHVSFGELSGDVTCVVKFDNFASIYFDVDGTIYVTTVVDLGEGHGIYDIITTPEIATTACEIHGSENFNFVEGGNIQVHK